MSLENVVYPAARMELNTLNTCRFVVGRLMEVRVGRGFRNVADVDEMIGMVATAVRPLGAAAKFSIVADWRPVQVMAPETAARAREMLVGGNVGLQRSAILTLSANPTTNLQVVRLIHEAENENRRHFTSPVVLQRWLCAALTPEESARVAEFLGIAPVR